MRIALLSDIHSNILALKAVLEHSLTHDIDNYWFLGDLIGYGPNPIEAMQWIMGDYEDFLAPSEWVMGNHDVMLAELILKGRTGVADEITKDPLKNPIPDGLKYPNDINNLDEDDKPFDFNIHHRNISGKENGSILYTGTSKGLFHKYLHWEDLSSITPLVALELNRVELSKHEDVDSFWRHEFILDRVKPHQIHGKDLDIVLVHGSQVVPVLRYVYAWGRNIVLVEELRKLNEQAEERKHHRIQVFGHTHVQTFVRAKAQQNEQEFEIDAVYVTPGIEYPLILDPEKISLAMINPGSVGQPRDLDPRAAYAVLDTNKKTVTFYRVDYNFREVFRQLQLKHYPNSLALKILNATTTKGTPMEWEAHYRKIQKGAV